MHNVRLMQRYDRINYLFGNCNFLLKLKRVAEIVNILLQRMIIVIHIYLADVIDFADIAKIPDHISLIREAIDGLQFFLHLYVVVALLIQVLISPFFLKSLHNQAFCHYLASFFVPYHMM